MGYRLRKDLNKTVVYNVVDAFAPSGIVFPGLCKVDFKKYQGTYWLKMQCVQVNGSLYEGQVTLQACAGSVKLRYFFSDFDSCDEFEKFVTVPFEYLQENGLLKEVA